MPSTRSTRARTRPGRLVRLDEDLCLEEAALLSRSAGVVVDLGFGAVPATTHELAAALPPHLSVVGVEPDADALRTAGPGSGRVRFLAGGFTLPEAARPALVIRAMNVLRGYPPAEAAPAREAMGAALVEGGALLEGTSGPDGDVMVVGWWRRREGKLVPEALLFSTRFDRGFGPLVFRDRLPRDLRGAVRPGTPLFGLFADWTAAYEAVRSVDPDPRGRFLRAAEWLSRRRQDVPARPDRWAAGRLWWRTPVFGGKVGT